MISLQKYYVREFSYLVSRWYGSIYHLGIEDGRWVLRKGRGTKWIIRILVKKDHLCEEAQVLLLTLEALFNVMVTDSLLLLDFFGAQYPKLLIRPAILPSCWSQEFISPKVNATYVRTSVRLLFYLLGQVYTI
jgi:hypothetical protein